MGKKKIKNPGISFRVNQPRLSIAMTPGKKKMQGFMDDVCAGLQVVF